MAEVNLTLRFSMLDNSLITTQQHVISHVCFLSYWFFMKKDNQALAAQLTHFTHSFIPHLNFSNQLSGNLLSNDPKNWQSDQQVIIDLYESIKKSTPEADNSYWLTRTWTLVCWQPLYIAFISIYGLNNLPNLSHFKQRRNQKSMQGISFLSGEFQAGDRVFLVKKAAETLNSSFEYYRQLLDDAYRCRPRFTQALLSDSILIALLELKEHSPTELPAEYIMQQAQVWLGAFLLPAMKECIFVIDPTSLQIIHTRESCCFVYKTEQGKLCTNCPRIKENEDKYDNLATA